MPSTFKTSFYIGAVGAALFGLWLTQLWGAENQVRLHNEHFLAQIEQRDWAGAGDFISAEYQDDWGHDRTTVLQRLRLVLRAFTSLTIEAANPQVSADPPAGWWSAKVRISGGGSEFAPEIVARVNGLTDPFALHWRRESRYPWDWKLVRVSNPSLEISGGYY